MSGTSLTVCLVSIMLTPLAAAGLAIIHQGLGRSRSAAHAMLATLCALAIAAIVFVVFGSSFFGYCGGQFYSIDLAGIPWNTLGAEPFFAAGTHFDPTGIRAALELCLMVFAAGVAAIIPISAGTDRWRMIPICYSTALLAAFAFPLFAHWTWASGWLGQLPANFALPGLLDTAGAGTIHVVGGLAALSVAWILGPRRGKYTPDNMASAIPGHNIVMVLFGCLLALVGWIGLSSAAALLFAAAQPEQIAAVILNAALSASSGCLAAVVTTRIRYRKPDASLSANGWIAGLVAGSAASGFVAPAAAIFTGLVAGVLVAFLVEIFELHLLVDDPGGAISVHAGAGLWGLLAAGFFAHTTGTHAQQFLVQLVGIATLLGCMLPLIHGGNLLLNRFVRFRVDSDGDWQGMDIRELGAGAYPEFVIHADEFVPR
jgi:Amt family ammonium transporter